MYYAVVKHNKVFDGKWQKMLWKNGDIHGEYDSIESCLKDVEEYVNYRDGQPINTSREKMSLHYAQEWMAMQYRIKKVTRIYETIEEVDLLRTPLTDVPMPKDGEDCIYL